MLGDDCLSDVGTDCDSAVDCISFRAINWCVQFFEALLDRSGTLHSGRELPVDFVRNCMDCAEGVS